MSLTTALITGAVALLLAPVFDGVARKTRAVIHSRKGPPITQTCVDLIKLLGKEDLRPSASPVFRFAPSAVFAAFLVAALMIPIGAEPAVGIAADMIVWAYVLTLGAAALVLFAAAAANPFARAGAAREIMMLLSVEPIVMAALVTAAVKSGSLRLTDMAAWNLTSGPAVSMLCAGAALLLALQATMGKLPFDIAEAESEIVDGPLVEQSGPGLALLRWGLMIRQLVYCLLLVQVFFPWPVLRSWPLAVAAVIVKLGVLIILSAVVEAVSPRLRIDQAMSYAGRTLFVALAALAFALIGV